MDCLELEIPCVKLGPNFTEHPEAYGNNSTDDHGRSPRDMGRGQRVCHFDLTLERTQRRAIGSLEACVRPPQKLAKTADEKPPRAPCFLRTRSAALEVPVTWQPGTVDPFAQGGHYERSQQ